MIQLLGEQEVPCDVLDGNGWAPSHVAARKGHCAVLKQLHKMGVNMEQRNQNNWAPLHIAVVKGTTPSVTCLVREVGVNVNTRGPAGWTPLHLTCHLGRRDLAELLIK